MPLHFIKLLKQMVLFVVTCCGKDHNDDGRNDSNEHLGVEEGCLGRKACSTSLQVDEEESVLKIRSSLC